MCNSVSVNCMLDSGAMNSFVHPHIVQSMAVQPSQGAVLTVTMANGANLLCDEVHTLDLMFALERGDRQVTVKS